MSYQTALEAAGAQIKDFKEFGSYQGTWFAILDDGRLIEGYYGSCSGCDAYEAEFGCSGTYDWGDGTYSVEGEDVTKEVYDEAKRQEAERLIVFGQSYLQETQTVEEALNRYKIKIDEDYAWEDDKEIYEWLKSKAI